MDVAKHSRGRSARHHDALEQGDHHDEVRTYL